MPHVPAASPAARPNRLDLVLLAVAVAAVSTSAPLIRDAAVPTLVIAFWRNVMAIPPLVPVALRSPMPSPRDQKLVAVAGLLLAAHFATWVPSLSYTSVASSVALVATQPVWAALIAKRRGQYVGRGTWVGIGISLVGVVVLTGVDLSISPRALFGDALALVGGFFAAAYVTVGAEVRQRVGTATYAVGGYGVAAVALLIVCLLARRPLVGYDARAWLTIAALAVGAQLIGHTLMSLVLRSISPTAVSVSILFEVIGAAIIAFLWFGERPPLAAIPAGVLIGAGVVEVIRSSRAEPRGQPTSASSTEQPAPDRPAAT